MKFRELIILVASLLTMFFAAQVNAAATSCDRLFYVPLQSTEIPSVRERELKSMAEIEYGGLTARTVRYKDRTFIYDTLGLIENWSRADALFSEATAQSLVKIGPVEANALLPELSVRIDKFGTLSWAERAAYEISTAVHSYVSSREMRDIKYNGRAIAPIVPALVRNDGGLVVGRLITKTPGKTISDLIEENKISTAQIDSAIDQVVEQVKLLASVGKAHHNLGSENIMVSITPGGHPSGKEAPVKARLIGFSHPNGKGRPIEAELAYSIEKLEGVRAILNEAARRQKANNEFKMSLYR